MIIVNNGIYRISDFQLLSIPSLTIKQGENWAFIGRNGSGKSSLAKALIGELILQQGQQINQFKSIAYLSLERLQKWIDQEWQYNNTDLYLEGEGNHGRKVIDIIQDSIIDIDRCRLLAKQFGIEDLLDRHFKYLSTGEMRKVLLCRLFMLPADLFVFDEPFDGLDALSRKQLTMILANFAKKGITTILILNRFSDIPQFVQYLGILRDKQLVECGLKPSMLEDKMIKPSLNPALSSVNQLPLLDEEMIQLDDDVPRIILNQGYVHYNGKAIIDGLNWRVEAGQHWQIIGPNGAGKSTLLSLVTGDHPQGYSNDLTLFGRKRGSGETIWEIKRHIGYVSHQLHLDYRVSSSVREVLISGYMDSIGIYTTISDRQYTLANQWLKLLNLLDKAEQPFSALSWGQQRLLLITRALVKHPTLLILDEPLQGLDQNSRDLIKSWIDFVMAAGHSQLLFVSHYEDDAPSCITHRLIFVPTKANNYQYKNEILAKD
ncbi:molybdate ABC transporter ATP-binding protein ModF [Candidatus Schmidhempelia bombi str. Bimp]|uniref:Molybdate ABC transporter ATP-binding protein ModF n=2 Tax=Candidatus Schmidhempelia TaxID=1505768 RepID=A0AB94IDY6_9GAMM|nr:molybdate ABC transporter ATP-binding protein ModF [Candidatus Schmidhempelia bombi]TEA27678.1 molybdate ABC transporter ATP-binding protein ModF [Candidatus Schmidhempelia bombi str. Bimp]